MTHLKALSIALCLAAISGAIFAWGSGPPEVAAVQDEGGKMTREEAKKLKSPVPYTKDSIAKGRTLFALQYRGF